MAEILKYPAKEFWGGSNLDKMAPILPIYEAMFWTEPAELAAFCEATRETVEYIERERRWGYFADAGSLASLIGAYYQRRKKHDHEGGTR